MLESGERVDRYIVQALIGQGGMAFVFKVRHADFPKDYALKVLVDDRDGLRRRFEREIELLARLQHPNIVEIHNAFPVHDRLAFVMEYLPAGSLRDHLDKGPLALPEAIELFRGVVRGVGAAHHAGVIHRDLKPENILLDRRAGTLHPKVADFGIARPASDPTVPALTAAGSRFGTPGFLAPEVMRGIPADARADVFALGAILYELVCGFPPFRRSNRYETDMANLNAEFEPPARFAPACPPEVLELITLCLRLDRDDRPPSCEAILAHIEQVDLSASGSPSTRSAAAMLATHKDWAPPEVGRAEALSTRAGPPLALAGSATFAHGDATRNETLSPSRDPAEVSGPAVVSQERLPLPWYFAPATRRGRVLALLTGLTLGAALVAWHPWDRDSPTTPEPVQIRTAGPTEVRGPEPAPLPEVPVPLVEAVRAEGSRPVSEPPSRRPQDQLPARLAAPAEPAMAVPAVPATGEVSVRGATTLHLFGRDGEVIVRGSAPVPVGSYEVYAAFGARPPERIPDFTVSVAAGGSLRIECQDWSADCTVTP